MVNHVQPSPAQDDEQAIRTLIATWHHATAAGDLPQLLSLMAEDVIFLTPGQPPMRGRDTFAAGFQAALKHYRIDPSGEVVEIEIAGGWAYCWSQLDVTMTPLQAGVSQRRTGSTLTILHKQPDGTWVIIRDANMLTVEPSAIS